MDSVLDVDTEKRTVKAVWSRMGNIDLDMDIMAAGCFNRTVSQRGPSGKNQIWSLVDHNPSIKSALGKPSELYVEGDMLVAVTKIVDISSLKNVDITLEPVFDIFYRLHTNKQDINKIIPVSKHYEVCENIYNKLQQVILEPKPDYVKFYNKGALAFFGIEKNGIKINKDKSKLKSNLEYP